MSSPQRHLYTRSYFGEFTAAPLIEWLNSPSRPASDPVGELVRLNAGLPLETTEHEVQRYLGRLVRNGKFGDAPVLVEANRNGWKIDWSLTVSCPAQNDANSISLSLSPPASSPIFGVLP